ncbi:MAG: hypothetical protein LQ351_002303 [Letrouitia transgressa]|nr:MAG: hypothetical protein LQ351_002303 [Letrouitia transgressa]
MSVLSLCFIRRRALIVVRYSFWVIMYPAPTHHYYALSPYPQQAHHGYQAYHRSSQSWDSQLPTADQGPLYGGLLTDLSNPAGFPDQSRPIAGTNSAHAQSNIPSVKHLTCFFWFTKGSCRWSDNQCLYAHYYTGQVANGPVQVEPGRPAVAGKNALSTRPKYTDWHSPFRGTEFQTKPKIGHDLQIHIDSIVAQAEVNRETHTLGGTIPQQISPLKRAHSAGISVDSSETTTSNMSSRPSKSQKLSPQSSDSSTEIALSDMHMALLRSIRGLASMVHELQYTCSETRKVHATTGQALHDEAERSKYLVNDGFVKPLQTAIEHLAEIQRRQVYVDKLWKSVFEELEAFGQDYLLGGRLPGRQAS